ncbi:hypothetical protein [Streptomyces noursei]|uniref:hypothetical protein n=1 Tax=Streptomyces noursei TaxID=1971 RepID=UPI0007CD7194|nr:hypothetical protein A4V12_18360 [Streptomyces noursei]
MVVAAALLTWARLRATERRDSRATHRPARVTCTHDRAVRSFEGGPAVPPAVTPWPSFCT